MSGAASALERWLAPIPREPFAHLPTPIEPMSRLSEAVGGGARLHAKRDDYAGFATGGNKARQIEFYFGEALAEGCDTVVITGAVQSNFVRCTAAAAARLGMRCHIQLEDRVAGKGDEYHGGGNVLLDKLFGATLSTFPVGEDEGAADTRLEEIADELRSEGRKPYVIHLSPGYKPLSALGYVRAMGETLDQADAAGMNISNIVLCSGSAATHAGTLVGLRLAGSNIPVIGSCVRRTADLQAPRVAQVIGLLQDLLGCGDVVDTAEIDCRDNWFAGGYGKLDDSTREALEMAGRLEGIPVDPTYTAKSMAAMIGLGRAGAFEADTDVLWIHTGGLPGLFAYWRDIYPDVVKF
ncbi:MAG: D-cysteine desulfhydrase family protein [Rhodospirillaceae bacterium]|jgi:D-cysteine desulfhydrase family pyridoxal phosphate-dependent enzyme|nr:D-cysteine desulfhydrase family protein [Rhodospirillaceae bacterium]